MNANNFPNTLKVNTNQVVAFLVLTFGLTWALDLLVYLNGGLTNQSIVTALQMQMAVPAAVAIFLGLFVFRESPVHLSHYEGRPRLFFLFYLAFSLIFLGLTGAGLYLKTQTGLISLLSSAWLLIGLIVLVAIRLVSGKEAFLRAGLAGGRFSQWLVYGVGVVLFYGLTAALNMAFGLGKAVDIQTMLNSSPATATMPATVFVLVSALQTILIGPLVGLLLGFGEEFGWRGFLQSQLVRLGKKRGVLLVGLIWSAWHYPVILMGYNYPGHPIAGLLMMTVYTTLLAFVLGYAMLKTGSIWLAAFLHGLNNQTMAYIMIFVYQPADPLWSFSAGVYSIPLLLLVVLLLLRDPIWKDVRRVENESQPNLQPQSVA
jgi:membrane protease YdiL (CAAX protease family)